MSTAGAPLVVGILGAGRIAQGFDEPGSPHVLTLAHAVRTSPAFALGGFFDIEAGRAAAAERKWGCPDSPRERAAWLDRRWDVVCVATPENAHAADLRDVLARAPRAVVMEKPVALDADEGARLLREAEARGIAVLVDYPRRWHSGVAALAGHVAEGRLGAPMAVVLAYSGESVRAATHMLDLFHTCWGGGWQACRSGGAGHLVLRRGREALPVSCVRLPARPYYLWEMHVYCGRGKVQLAGSPEVLDVQVLAPHPTYPSYEVLTTLERHRMEDEPLLPRLMQALADAIATPHRARALLRREMESHALGAGVLACLDEATPILSGDLA
jgi:hypothetical protein